MLLTLSAARRRAAVMTSGLFTAGALAGAGLLRQWDLLGKCDGLTAGPFTRRIFATVNEDAHFSVYTIAPLRRWASRCSTSGTAFRCPANRLYW